MFQVAGPSVTNLLINTTADELQHAARSTLASNGKSAQTRANGQRFSVNEEWAMRLSEGQRGRVRRPAHLRAKLNDDVDDDGGDNEDDDDDDDDGGGGGGADVAVSLTSDASSQNTLTVGVAC
jgi:hypothetical protein